MMPHRLRLAARGYFLFSELSDMVVSGLIDTGVTLRVESMLPPSPPGQGSGLAAAHSDNESVSFSIHVANPCLTFLFPRCAFRGPLGPPGAGPGCGRAAQKRARAIMRSA